jgi:hypothetical protein
MARQCTICNHPHRAEIETKIVNGESNRAIASQHDVNYMAVSRHRRRHLLEAFTKAKAAKEVLDADQLLGKITLLYQKSMNILEKAETADDWSTALRANREVRGNLELLAKLHGQLQDQVNINIINNVQWIELRAVIKEALEPYPEARVAVLQAMKSMKAD